MSIFEFLFGKKEKSAALAKDRLQIIIAQERVKDDIPDYLPMLQQELLQVLAKYVQISEKDIKINHDTRDGVDMLELNITLPEERVAANMKKNNQQKSPMATSIGIANGKFSFYLYLPVYFYQSKASQSVVFAQRFRCDALPLVAYVRSLLDSETAPLR